MGWVFFISILCLNIDFITLRNVPLEVYIVVLLFLFIFLHFARLFAEVNVNSEYITWEYKALLFKKKGRRAISFFKNINIEAGMAGAQGADKRRYFSVTLVPSNPCHVYDDFRFVYFIRLVDLVGERSVASFAIRISNITGLPIRLDDTMYTWVNKDDIEQLLEELGDYV